jgi:hypothetical protein
MFGMKPCLAALIHREKAAAIFEISLLWLRVDTAATTEIKTDMKSWEVETTPLRKVRGTSFSSASERLF